MTTYQFRWIMAALFSIAAAAAAPLPLSVVMAAGAFVWGLGAFLGGRRRRALRHDAAGKHICFPKGDSNG